MVICDMGTSYTIIETIRNFIILIELGIVIPVFILGILIAVYTMMGIIIDNISGMFSVKNDEESKKKTFTFKRCFIIIVLTLSVTLLLGTIYFIDMFCYKTMIEPCVAVDSFDYFFNTNYIKM